MTDAATIISGARIGWQVLAKMPWLTCWLLRRFFPVSKCKSRFLVDMPGNHARFELLSVRPSPALVGLEIHVFNPLPFAVEFETFRLTANVDSTRLVDAVLNTRHLVPATGSARIPLPEIGLTDQQANWVRDRQKKCTRVQVNLHWRCKSTIHSWESQDAYECLAYVNKNDSEASS